MARIVVEKLSKVFPGRKGERVVALNAVSFAVEEGEWLALVGPSGCGKTTTLRLIAGLEEPSSGNIVLDGLRANQVPAKSRDIAMVFQQPSLYPHLTAYENLAFGLRARRCPWTEVDRRVREAAETLGISNCLERRPMELSGGQRQRVAVGRALVRQPRLILFDEPLSDLDSQTRAQLRDELLRLRSRLSMTAIYVTHDQAEAMTAGDRVAVMRQSEIQQIDAPLQVYRRPANLFVAGFMGVPPMNFIKGRAKQQGKGIVFETNLGCPAAAPAITLPVEQNHETPLQPYLGKEIVLGVRPEDLTLAKTTSVQPRLEGYLEAIEELGAERHAHLKVGQQFLVMRLPPACAVGRHERVAVTFAWPRAHFFDAGTGRAIL